MVRVNLIKPIYLTDQHLIAEYLEILMLFSSAKKYGRKRVNENKIPKKYCLGKGHITFFYDKLEYLKKRHEEIKKEMEKRGFKTDKKINLKNIHIEIKKNWEPCLEDKKLIKKRLIEKINLKPSWYRYYRENKSKKFLNDLIKNAR